METKRHEAVVVTGASSGIGAATAAHLIAVGYRVFGTIRRDEDEAALRSVGAIPVMMDVSDEDSIASAVEIVREALGTMPLRGLVNNAGIPCAGPLEAVPMDEVRRAFEVNVLGTLAVTRAYLSELKRSAGRIVNISSVSARIPYPFLGPYAASKAALEAMTHSLRRELAPFGVGVTIIQPGSIRTRIWNTVERMDAAYLIGTPYEDVVARVRRMAASGGRNGLSPHVVADAVARALTRDQPAVHMPVVRSRIGWLLTSSMPVTWLDRLIFNKVWHSTTRTKRTIAGG